MRPRPSLGADDLNTEKAPIKFVYILRDFWPISWIYLHNPALLMWILFVLATRHMELKPLCVFVYRQPATRPEGREGGGGGYRERRWGSGVYPMSNPFFSGGLFFSFFIADLAFSLKGEQNELPYHHQWQPKGS